MKQILLTVLLLASAPAFSDVWEDTNTWSMEWEKKYAKWIQTSAVHTRMFTSKKSKYFGVRADGADALRAIFKGYGFFQTTIRDDLNYICIINYRRGVRINLHHIYDRLSKVLMTLHSNDGKFMNYEDYKYV